MKPGGDDTTLPLDESAASDPAHASLPGGKIGRFVVVGALGSGGMGVVLSAHDPTLDRKVAIKLLRPEVYASAGRERLQREAQAMARVSHPNVATVYEVGTVGEQLFVAMELVDGDTLKPWMRARPPWRKVVEMFAAAGRGLEAAHAAGLVHRDFKPDNVLVGKDGRPRVSDFGLVSVRTTASGNALATHSAGGTPAYMAPEQVRGESADARSDQFSFCVALWEALFGERPFADDAAPADRHAPERKGREVPAWLTAIAARGLSNRPEDRFASMSELLEALGRDPAISRRRTLMRAGAVALAGLALVGVKLQRDQQARVCSHGTARLVGVWDQAQKQRLEAAFVKLPRGAVLWPRVRELLDGYAARWVATHEEACRATRLEGRQSEALLDLRMACLDRRRATLGALANLLAGPLDAKGLERTPAAANSLPSLDDCNDLRALSEPLPLPRDRAAQKQIAEARAQLDAVKALLATSNWKEARKAAETAQSAADATSYAPVQAEARLLLGTAVDRMSDPAAVPQLQEAARLAGLAHDDRLAAHALILLVKALSTDSVKFAEAQAVVPVAAAFIARAGDPPDLRGALMTERAHAFLDGGKPIEAKRLALDAKALLEKALPPRAPEIQAATSIAAGAADDSGDYEMARATFQQLADDARALYGPESPKEALMLKNQGMVEEHCSQYRKAGEYYEKSLDILVKRLGPANAEVADVMTNLGNVALNTGRFDDAAALYEKALDMLAAIYAPDHAYVAVVKSNLGGARREQGRLDDAARLGQEALAIALKAYGENHPQYATLENELGHTLYRRGDYVGARARYTHALGVFRAALGPDSPLTLNGAEDLAEIEARHGHCTDERPKLEHLATAQESKIGATAALATTFMAITYCDLSEKRAADAVKHAERAVAILHENAPPALLARARFQLAQACWAAGERPRALEVARTAESELKQAGAAGKPELARLEPWLAQHAR